jgi:proteasome assembly chaperone (PAC2) family protein
MVRPKILLYTISTYFIVSHFYRGHTGENVMENREELLKVYDRPHLKDPFFVAAGPGTANVGLTTASYLKDKLGAKLLAEIEPGDFFTPPYSFAFRDGLIELSPVDLGVQAPQNRFYYWKSQKGRDLMFFTGNAHPLPGKVPDLASYVMDVAQSFGVMRLFMPGAFITDIHHLSEPVISGVATNSELVEYLQSHQIAMAPPINIAHNLNAWLVGMAKKKNIEAIGLVSEIAIYNSEEPNFRACRALLRVLCKMLSLDDIDLSDLNYRLAEEEALIQQRVEELRASTDEGAVDFLRYLDMLGSHPEHTSVGQGMRFPTQEELPESLKYIEELYTHAREDESKVHQLRIELEHLERFDRLLILSKYGDEILRLLGKQM